MRDQDLAKLQEAYRLAGMPERARRVASLRRLPVLAPQAEFPLATSDVLVNWTLARLV
jgi:hypothetical protein